MTFTYNILFGQPIGRNAVAKEALRTAIRRITRPTINEFSTWCRPKFCGSGTELVEPFLIESYDADEGVVALSVSYIGTLEWATSSESDQAATALGSIIERRLSALYPYGVTVVYTGRSTQETYWPDVDPFTGFVLGHVEPAIKGAGRAITKTFTFLSRNWEWVGIGLVGLIVIMVLKD